MAQTNASIDLLRMHIDAMFTIKNERLVAVNEPWDQTKKAPRLYVGWAVDGGWQYRVRHDLDDTVAARIASVISSLQAQAVAPEACIPKLAAALNSDAHNAEICYHIPALLPPYHDCILITTKNIDGLQLGEFSWLQEECATAQPCAALIAEGQVASLCRSVRISPRAHEAGIETSLAFRGRGYASAVLSHWANAVRAMDCVPLYSTSWDNGTSQHLAQKAGLATYAKGVSIL